MKNLLVRLLTTAALACMIVFISGTAAKVNAQDYNSGRLWPGQALYPNQTLWTPNGTTWLTYQGDGNLVLRDNRYTRTNFVAWHSGTYGTSPGVAVMQTDGNLVIYDASGRPVWNTRTGGNPGAYLGIHQGNFQSWLFIDKRNDNLWWTADCYINCGWYD